MINEEKNLSFAKEMKKEIIDFFLQQLSILDKRMIVLEEKLKKKIKRLHPNLVYRLPKLRSFTAKEKQYILRYVESLKRK